MANKTHSDARLTTRTLALVQDLRARLEQSPQKSTRRLSQEVGVSRSSVMTVKAQILEAQSQANKYQPY